MTHIVQWTCSQNFSTLALPVWDWQGLEYIWTNGLLSHLINKLMDQGNCRIAPATPGLLKRVKIACIFHHLKCCNLIWKIINKIRNLLKKVALKSKFSQTNFAYGRHWIYLRLWKRIIKIRNLLKNFALKSKFSQIIFAYGKYWIYLRLWIVAQGTHIIFISTNMLSLWQNQPRSLFNEFFFFLIWAINSLTRSLQLSRFRLPTKGTNRRRTANEQSNFKTEKVVYKESNKKNRWECTKLNTISRIVWSNFSF